MLFFPLDNFLPLLHLSPLVLTAVGSGFLIDGSYLLSQCELPFDTFVSSLPAGCQQDPDVQLEENNTHCSPRLPRIYLDDGYQEVTKKHIQESFLLLLLPYLLPEGMHIISLQHLESTTGNLQVWSGGCLFVFEQ